MKTLFLKPAPGRQVRDPVSGQVLPEAGAEVPATNYWTRRLQDGDVIQAAAPKAEAPTKTKGKE